MKHLSIDKETADKFFKVLWPEFMKSGLSIVAVNDETGNVVGVTTCYDPAVFSSYGFFKIINLYMSIPKKVGPFVALAEEA